MGLLVRKGIATRYYGSALGWIWSYVRPAAQFLMYDFIFGTVFQAHRDIPNFSIYLFSGIITINLFSEALRNTTDSITGNASLVKKIYLPRELFPVSAIGVAFVHFLPQAVILLIVCIFLGWTITWMQLLALVLGIFIVLVFALGLGLFFGSINVAQRDARNIVDLILMFATWLSPVLYQWTMLKAHLSPLALKIYMINPVTVTVELFHNVFWAAVPTDGRPLPERPSHLMLNALIGLVIALVTLLIGQLTFRKLEGNFAQHL
ncbi:ABC transporter permease [Leucobacter viscericola]|uniref:ABC transporter permease n=1 Tax=Leucobacter viscericola TaxID=2714935 RepID=UPI0031377F73